MKQYKHLLIFMICVMLSGFAGSILLLQKNEKGKTDIILLNDIAQTAMEHWEDIEGLREHGFGADYAVFDAEGNVIFASAKTEINRLNDVVKKQYPYLVLSKNGELLGSVAVLGSQKEVYARQERQALGVLALSGCGMIFCMLFWGIYVKKNVVVPFQKMEKFAGEIAAGNLEIPLRMEKDNMFGSFTESFDIMREELLGAREREILLKKQEKELVASLSHDLKTPVTGIKLTAELMMARAEEPAVLEKLDNIYKKAEQIDALVSDLFTSTLKDLGEMKVSPADTDSSILHELVRRCDDKRLVKEAEIPECIIKIDNGRMGQIIGNIISNSYKYANTPIDIAYTIIEGYLKMSVRDYGAGVLEEETELVTNKFFRGKASKDGKTDGSGLGLYIAKTLMEKMNGELRCLNANPGFEVWLLIPLS